MGKKNAGDKNKAKAKKSKQALAPVVGLLVRDGAVSPLTQSQFLRLGEPIPRDRVESASVSAYLAFTLADELTGPVTAAQALGLVDLVYGASVLGEDSAGEPVVVTGALGVPAEMDLSLEGVLVNLDGSVVTSASGAAIMGHPAEALAAAANQLAAEGESISAGALVLVGPLTPPVEVSETGSLALEFTSLGTLHLNGGTPPL